MSKKSKNWLKGLLRKPYLFLRALKRFYEDNGLLLSSGLTFNLLMGLIPLFLLLLGIAGTYLYSDREVMNHIRRYLENVAPSLDPKIMRSIMRIIRDRRVVGVLGIGGLFWTSLWVFSSLRTTLNIVFRVERTHGFFRGMGIDLLIMFLVGGLHLSSMILTSALTYFQKIHFTDALRIGTFIGFSLKYLLPFLSTFWMFFFIYKIIPNKKISFHTAFQASLFTSIFWEAAKLGFGWFVLHVGRFSVIYGSLSTLVIFVMWVYYSSAILLLGGEVASLLEQGKS